MKNVNNHALEVRFALDLLAYELHRFDLPAGTPVRISSASTELAEDFADRLWPDHPVSAMTTEVVVHLLDLEQESRQEPLEGEHLLIGFRNLLSHKRLLYPDWQGLAYPSLERRVSRSHRLLASRGVMGPQILARVAIAEAARRLRRYPAAAYLTDRALLSPSSERSWRLLAPIGVIAARRRP